MHSSGSSWKHAQFPQRYNSERGQLKYNVDQVCRLYRARRSDKEMKSDGVETVLSAHVRRLIDFRAKVYHT